MKHKSIYMPAVVGAIAVAVLLSGCCTAGSRGSKCGGKTDTCNKCASPPASNLTGDRTASINTPALEALLRGDHSVTLLDARSGKYDDGNRIPGAHSLSPAATEQEIKALLTDADALIVTYCAGLTCPASEKLAMRLRELGYANVLEYPEGIAGWKGAGNKVDKITK